MRQERFPTRLDEFIARNKVSTTRLEQESGKTRKHIYFLRRGSVNPTLECMTAIQHGCSKITGRDVSLEELFDIPLGSRRAS